MDRYRLECERKRCGISIDDLCKKLKMTRGTYYRKCKGESEFTLSEINILIEVLNITNPMEIFFADKVS